MWRFELIGRFTVCRDHARIDRFPTEKTALLLARLVVQRGKLLLIHRAGYIDWRRALSPENSQ